MKYTLIILACSLLISCKKENKEETDPVFPDKWGLLATIGTDSFTATSLNGAVLYHKSTGTYEMNINSWDKNAQNTIYLSHQGFVYSPKTYSLQAQPPGEIKNYSINYAFLQHIDETLKPCKSGQLRIHSVTGNEIKGSFVFSTADGTPVQGTYTYELIYPVDTVD